MNDILQEILNHNTVGGHSPSSQACTMNEIQRAIIQEMLKSDSVFVNVPRQCGTSTLINEVLTGIAKKTDGDHNVNVYLRNNSHCIVALKRLMGDVKPYQWCSNAAYYKHSNIAFHTHSSSNYGRLVFAIGEYINTQETNQICHKIIPTGKVLMFNVGFLDKKPTEHIKKMGFSIIEFDWRHSLNPGQYLMPHLSGMTVQRFLEEYQNGKEFHVAYSL